MSLSSLSDVKYALRKREFPSCARETLLKAEEILSSPNVGRNQKEKQMEFISEIIGEFIFSEYSDRRTQRKKLTSIEELELVLVISDHMMFDCGGNEASRNAVFLSLFPPSKPHRIHLLVSLTSLALSTSCTPLLNAAAILIQQVGYNSSYSQTFALSLVEEFFLLINRTSPFVRDLPQIAPLFTANFLTTVSEVYGITGAKEFKEPPKELLVLVVEWLQSKTVCLSPLMYKLQPVLPQGGIPMPALTPYGGLFRWCLGSPKESSDAELYLSTEQSLLESLKESVHVHNRLASVISTVELLSLIPLVKDSQSDVLRLANILQIVIDTNALYGPRQELWKQLSLLPNNRLLESILQRPHIFHSI